MGVFQKLVYWLTIKPRLKKLKKLLPEAKIYPCGSRYVCDPPHFGTDVDFLVFGPSKYVGELTTAGYSDSAFNEYITRTSIDEFTSWRKGVVNLIVTTHPKFADRHNTATYICKKHNIRIKFERIMIYEALRGAYSKQEVDNWAPGLDPYVHNLIASFNGPYGDALYAAYKIKQGIS